MPLLQFPAELVARPCAQILKVVEEDPKDWLPDTFLQFLEGSSGQTGAGNQIFNANGTGQENTAPPQGAEMPPQENQPPNPMSQPPQAEGTQGAPQQSVQAGAGTAPMSAQKVVPGNQGPSLAQMSGKSSGLFNKKF